jgi:DnaJ-class molecular chaperone
MKDRKPAPQPCPFCHGAGQISSFKGVSRFLLTTEECPACGGTGLKLDDELMTAEPQRPKRRRNK